MKLKTILYVLVVVLLWSFLTQAQLSVMVSPVKVEGNKAVVTLAFKNNLTNAVESAHASVFLMNGDTLVGRGTKWVIGGTKNQVSLTTGGTNFFFFVIPSDKPFPKTNLTAKVNFSRVVLEGGKLADPLKDVAISSER